MRMMRILLIALITTISTLPDYAQPVNEHGQLRVDGTSLVNSAGQPYRLRGMGLPRHNWWDQFWNASVVNWLYTDWNCNALRAAVGVEEENGYLYNSGWAMEKIKEVVDAAIATGIYVIIDWHSHDIFTQEAKNFFIEMAQTYGKYPNVLYEILNEPDYESWNDVKNYAIEIIANIRAIDPDNIILVGSPNWSQDLDIVADDRITGFDNLMYTAHFYAASHPQRYRDRWNYALSQGIPVFISECGAMKADGRDPINYWEWDQWVQWMDDNNLSWFPWAIGTKEGFASSTLIPSANFSGGWSDSDLTEWGRMCRDLLRSYSDPDPSPPPPATKDVYVNLFTDPSGTDILVLIENDPVETPLFIKFLDGSGKIAFESTIESTVSHIPVSFPKGVYFVHVGRGDQTFAEVVLVL